VETIRWIREEKYKNQVIW